MNKLNCANRIISTGNRGFLLYLAYIIFILFRDAIDLLCFFVGWPQPTILSAIIAVAGTIGVWFYFRKHLKHTKIGISLGVIICIVAISIYGVFKSVIPDLSYDTMNYHLLIQDPGFKNYFQYNVAPGNFQMFGFALPDRMFYYPRLFLGYRMGTLMNTAVFLLMYVQTYELLKILYGEKLAAVREKTNQAYGKSVVNLLFSEWLLAFAIVMVHDVVGQYGTYLIDSIGIPVALELVRILVTNNNEKHNSRSIMYFAFLAGVFFCMKMTHIVYLVPLVIAFVWQNIKEFNWKLFLACIVVGLSPVAIYMAYNFSVTGNPVFPYFNAFFSSAYYGDTNFKDVRWGPSNITEAILWPLYLIINPKYRQSEVPNIWPYGFIGALVACLYFGYNKIRKRILPGNKAGILYAVFVVSLYLWTVSTGHIRYFVFGFILSGILFVDFYIDVILNQKKLINSVSLLLCTAVLIAPCVNFYQNHVGIEFAFRSYNKDTWQQNAASVLKDRSFANEQQSEKVDVFLLNTVPSGGWSYIINEDTPAINNYYIHEYMPEESSREYNKAIASLLSDDLGVYDVFPQSTDFETYVNQLNEYGIKLKSMEWLDTQHLYNRDNVALVELAALEIGEENQIYYCNESGRNQVALTNYSDSIELSFHAGLLYDFGWFDIAHGNNVRLQVSFTDGTTFKNYEVVDIDEGMFTIVTQEFDVSVFSGDPLSLSFTLINDYGEIAGLAPYRCVILNPVINGGTIADECTT